MFLQILLSFFALVEIIFVFLSLQVKRVNYGFIVTTILLICEDVVCFFLLESENIRFVRILLILFYFIYSWIFLSAISTVVSMGVYSRSKLMCIPVAFISLYQSVLILGNLFGTRMLSFSKHILFGRNWWIAEGTRGVFYLQSFSFFRLLAIVNSAIILAFMIRCKRVTADIYSVKYIILIILQTLMLGFTVFSYSGKWPVWLGTLLMNIICAIVFYLANYYSYQKLRDFATTSFANEMSDGFLVYDDRNDLVYMNDLLKKTLSEDILKSFANIENTENWLSQTEDIEGMDVLVYNKGTRRYYFRSKKNEFRKNRRLVATIYTLHDTTDSAEHVKLMAEANEELERAGQMKSDFLANMSHEIRTPMNAVIGMAEIALREDVPPQVVECLTQIQRSGRNLLNIINDILDYSKIEAGKMEIVPEDYEPLSEINDIANIIATRIGNKDIKLFMIIDPRLPHKLTGDAMRIRQILVNICNNAVKFTTRGFVHVSLTCEQTDDENVLLTYHVRDTGSGIKENDLEKLFVSFQQVDSKRNRNVEGTGLGLAISKSLCEAMGGTIGVESEYGKGSDFYFSIPQKVADPARDLVVEEPDRIHGFCLNEKNGMVDRFTDEMIAFGIEGDRINSLHEYRPTGKRDILFFEEYMYTHEMEEFLDRYRNELTGVVLLDINSGFTCDKPNVRIMRNPMTTLSMVMLLNNKTIFEMGLDKAEAFRIDYIAPDAKILIVDDNDINITIAEGLLKPLEVQCKGAPGGKEAVEAAMQEQFDIILMDHMMPGIDGVEATHILRQMVPNAKDTPIIALTANVMEGAREMFIKEGMNDLIAKPVDIRELVTKLKRWLPEDKIKEADKESVQPGSDAPEGDGKYSCLDCKRAAGALGSTELLDRIVEEYYRGGGKSLDGLQAAYESEDWDDLTRRVHTLKSASRQIGAFELGDRAETMEKAGNARDMDYIRAEYDGLIRSYRELLDSLSEYFPDAEEADEASLEEINGDVLKELFAQLSEACENLDMDMMDETGEKLKGYRFPDSKKEKVKALLEAIGNIDVEACTDIINEFGGLHDE